MKHIVLALFMFSFTVLIKGQTRPAAPVKDYSKTIKAQADTMGQLLLRKDYLSFAKFTYPKIVEMMGGEDSMVKTLRVSMDAMDAQGMHISKVSFGMPSKTVAVGRQLQCTIPQTIEMQLLSGRMVARSTLVGISDDEGKNWDFIDTANKDNPAMKSLMPVISSKLLIPAATQPKYYADKQ